MNLEDANRFPFQTAEFVELFTIATQAASGRRRELPPLAERCVEDYPEGSVFLTDCPINQLGLAIMRECKSRYAEAEYRGRAMSFVCRWMALGHAIEQRRLGDFIRGDGDEVEIHPAVFTVAATHLVDRDLNFDGGFEQAVQWAAKDLE